jgi:hypothetical protein
MHAWLADTAFGCSLAVFSIRARRATGSKTDDLMLSVAGLCNKSNTPNKYFRKRGGREGKTVNYKNIRNRIVSFLAEMVLVRHQR